MIDIFIAYSHNDVHYKDELKKFLRPLLRENRISMWDDFDIEAGQDWDAKIKERLYGADIMLLLVSADSLASDYFYGKEVAVSLERHARGDAIVVPVILRHCDWTETPLGALEALPEKGRPVVEWPTRDQALTDVVARLRRVVEGLELRRKNESTQAEALRLFRASCEAADHLFKKGNWVESRNAYASALSGFLPGFEPDFSLLQSRLSECDANIRADQEAAAALAVEIQRAKESDAKLAREIETQRLREEKEKLAQDHRNRIESTRKAASELSAQQPQGFKTLGNVLISSYGLWIVVGSVVFGVIILLWKPWASTEIPKKEDKVIESYKPVPDLLSDAFKKAKMAGNLPAIESFRTQNPNSSFETQAQQEIAFLEQKRSAALTAANIYLEEKDWENARAKLRIALGISPGDADILKKLEKIKEK